MLTVAVIIYIILGVFFGPLWPMSMFGRGGCLGQLIVAAWVALFIGGIISQIMTLVFFVNFCRTDSFFEILFIDTWLSELKGFFWIFFI